LTRNKSRYAHLAGLLDQIQPVTARIAHVPNAQKAIRFHLCALYARAGDKENSLPRRERAFDVCACAFPAFGGGRVFARLEAGIHPRVVGLKVTDEKL
jgi:hypothetical protein